MDICTLKRNLVSFSYTYNTFLFFFFLLLWMCVYIYVCIIAGKAHSFVRAVPVIVRFS